MRGNSAALFPPVVALPLSLDRDTFLTSLMGELAGTLEDVVGPEEASDFISQAGERVGEIINEGYRNALSVPELPRGRISEVLVDVSRRIQGGFYVVDEDDEQIVLANRSCSCSDEPPGRPSMCRMTANVFGVITAENLGYARVVLDRAMVDGGSACRVVVHLQPAADPDEPEGWEYSRSADLSKPRIITGTREA
jgi:predicted ArsR family transcriptional regulator